MLLALALLAIVAALVIGYAFGRARRSDTEAIDTSVSAAPSQREPMPLAVPHAPAATPAPTTTEAAVAEQARLIRIYEAEAASLRRCLGSRDAALTQLGAFAADRHYLFGELAQARAETARYRQLVVDLENDAPPPLLGAPGTPDNLKSIVGVGPVLERMLYQLGITSYRQIARWTERDIDEFDAKLPEFPGRIRRDEWVTQARALHQSAYGENLPSREPR